MYISMCTQNRLLQIRRHTHTHAHKSRQEMSKEKSPAGPMAYKTALQTSTSTRV